MAKHRIFKFVWLLTLALAGVASGAIAAESVVYFHSDVSGSPLVATNATGNVIWKESYRPYGERTVKAPAAADNDLWFTGKPVDEETGLSYIGARYYSPVLGRFMGVDPADFSESNIHSFNRYAYGNNNPIKNIDPDGKNAVTAFGGVLTEGYKFVTGQGFDGAMVAGALKDGYNGEGTGFWWAAGEDALSFGGGAIGVAAKALRTSTVISKEASVVVNGARGRASEARVLRDMGLSKNTKTVSSIEGRSIPDALTDAVSVEIKDAAKVNYTRQLRIQVDAARNSGRTSVLVTGRNTCVSGPCMRAFDQTIRRSDLGPQ